ncbi:restriction endonuclease subunit S [Sphingopyxis sp. YF1]|nr:restriction endonuclease subunit S [Sphingopyxis sp. YF1]
MVELADAFEESDLPFRVDVVDWHAVTPSFQAVIDRDGLPLLRERQSRWPVRTLGDLVTLQRGIDLPNQNRRLGNVPIMGSFGITGYHDQARCKGPGVTVGRSGASAGTVCYIDRDYWPLNTCLYVRDFKGNDPRFAFYFLQTFNLAGLNSGSAQPSLNRNYIHPVEARFPDPPEQRDIASVLAALDDKIELNRRMNETLERQAQAIFRDWFVDFGPVRRKMAGEMDAVAIMGGLTSDPVRAAQLAALFPDAFGDDGLPVGWAETAIGDLVKPQGGSTPSTGDETLWSPPRHYWATPKDLSNMTDLALFDTARQISDAGLAKITSGLLPPGSVLLSSRAPIGYLAITQVPVAINQGFIGLVPTAEVGSSYLYCWCKANMDKIVANANGSTFQEISKKNFRPITSAFPADRRLIAEFGLVADPLFARLIAAAIEIRTLTETRDYLLPRLMSGTVRVARESEAA